MAGSRERVQRTTAALRQAPQGLRRRRQRQLDKLVDGTRGRPSQRDRRPSSVVGSVHRLCIAASRCDDAAMSKTRTTLTIDEDVLRAVKVRAARLGKGGSEVIEEAVRRDLGLELLDRLWARNGLPEAEAVELAVE